MFVCLGFDVLVFSFGLVFCLLSWFSVTLYLFGCLFVVFCVSLVYWVLPLLVSLFVITLDGCNDCAFVWVFSDFYFNLLCFVYILGVFVLRALMFLGFYGWGWALFLICLGGLGICYWCYYRCLFIILFAYVTLCLC